MGDTPYGLDVALPLARRLTSLVSLAALTAVVLAGCGGESTTAEPSPPTSAPTSASSSAAPSSQPAEETPDEFCDSFLSFVDANSEFASRLDATSGQALVDSARMMFAMPTPIAMTSGARVSLDELVQGTLAQLESVPEVTVDVAPDPANAGRADPAEFDAYLQDTCPA